MTLPYSATDERRRPAAPARMLSAVHCRATSTDRRPLDRPSSSRRRPAPQWLSNIRRRSSSPSPSLWSSDAGARLRSTLGRRRSYDALTLVDENRPDTDDDAVDAADDDDAEGRRVVEVLTTMSTTMTPMDATQTSMICRGTVRSSDVVGQRRLNVDG